MFYHAREKKGANKLKKLEPLKRSTILAYGMGSLGNNIIYAFISTYLLVFYTESFGLKAASIGTLFLVARVWDGFNDPIMGIIVDNTETRWGKFRPYLLFVPFIMAGTTILCFLNPDLPVHLKLIYAYITYILWGMSFTAMDIPYWSMSAALTIDPVERNKVVMVPRTMSMVGFLVVNLTTLPLVSFLGDWTIVAIIYSIIAVCFTMITFLNVKERIHVKRDKKQTIKDVWILFKVNKPLRMALYSLFVLETMNYLRFSFAFYYLKYNFGKESMIPVFSGIYLIITVVGSIVSPIVSKRIGKRKAAIIGALFYSLSSIGMFFTGYVSLVPLFIWASIGAFFFGINNIALNSMVVDCVEYGEYKTGNRAEGMVFSTNIFKTKLASAVGGSLGAYALAIIGYVANQSQSLSTLESIHRLFTVYTGIFTVFSLLPLFYYELTEEVYKTVVGEMEFLKRGKSND